MGGHGGLNILPQKEWNVYNWDNRITVEKDKRLAREKKEEEDRQRQRSGAQARIDRIKYNQRRAGQKVVSPSPESESQSRSRSRSDSKIKSKLVQEMKEMNKSKHMNLFEQEEEQINKQETNKALMQREQEFFKEQPFDMSSKFLGTLNMSTPWYMKSKEITAEQAQIKLKTKEELDQFRKQDSSYFQVLRLGQKELQEEPQIKIEAREKESKAPTQRADITLKQEKKERVHKSEKKKEKKEKKEKDPNKPKKTKEEKLQKLAKKLKKMLGSEDEHEEKIRKAKEKEQLRADRLKRERLERQREQKLVSQVYTFDFEKRK